MSTGLAGDVTPWYTKQPFRRLMLAIFILIVLIEGYSAVFERRNDCDWHLILGRLFLDGNPFMHGHDWYPVPRTMLNGALATLPHSAAKMLLFAAAIGGLVVSLRAWNALAQQRRPLSGPLQFAAAAFAVLLLLPYVLRDLNECGLQILLLLFITAGGYALYRGRGVQCGFWLAVAACYKTVPLIFLPLLIWKRQWRAAAAMAAFTVVLCLLPAVYLGWDVNWRCNQQWLARIGASSQVKDPSQNTIEEPKQYNQGLQFAMARYLQSHPQDDPLHLDHPWFFQFGDLPPETSHYTVKGLMLLLAGTLAWRFRRPYGNGPAQGDLASEWAATALLCALISPLCWKQHLVLALPCALLVVRDQLFQRHTRGRKQIRWRICVLMVIAACSLLTKRLIWPREDALLLMSYKFDTLAVMLLMLLTLTQPRPAMAAAQLQGEEDSAEVRQPARLAAYARLNGRAISALIGRITNTTYDSASLRTRR